MTPPEMTDEQIAEIANSCRWSNTYHVDFAKAIIAARDKQWAEMLGEPVAFRFKCPDGYNYEQENDNGGGEPLYAKQEKPE